MPGQSQLLTQTQKILPQQLQMLALYHLNTMDMEQRIRDEICDNPLLEDRSDDQLPTEKIDPDAPPEEYKDWDEYAYNDIPDYRLENQVSVHNNSINLPIKDMVDPRADLKHQLAHLNLNGKEYQLALFILDCISDNGYLERTVAEVADDFSFINGTFIEESAIELVLKKMEMLEPAGIASRNIREFLIKQLLNEKGSPIVKKSLQLVTGYYEELQKRNFAKICRMLEIDEEELSIIIKHISRLRLSPLAGAMENYRVKNSIIPDFILIVEGDTLGVELYKERANTLFVHENILKDQREGKSATAEQKSNLQYLKSKASSARWFVDAIREREENMLQIMRAIIRQQKKYFLSGDKADRQPMILKDIAAQVRLDISTISRVTCNKYIDTPYGLILLKDLFSGAMVNEQGQSISNKVVQLKLKELIEKEDPVKPYNDIQLVKMLAGMGIKIARRTVAKYREQLLIPVGEFRRLWTKESRVA